MDGKQINHGVEQLLGDLPRVTVDVKRLRPIEELSLKSNKAIVETKLLVLDNWFLDHYKGN